ncbi:MAG: hypothetical protein CGW95_16120 [Phenylobacterium zucineum]|nr:MAG: hypothetical protein CGW95_16120 [Phenylobacterium zucineum]
MDRRGFLQVGAASLLVAPALALAEPTAAEAWPTGCITMLPKAPVRRVAWTVDDGSSTQALYRYVDLLNSHPELRMTFFVLSSASGWRKVAPELAPMVKSGRVQIGNHTARHPNLQQLTNSQIQRELLDCHHFIQDHFGIDEKPIFRPPYGDIDSRVIKAAADVGFTAPILWWGTFASGAGVASGTVAGNAKQWLLNGRIVIDHANSMSTPRAFPYVMSLLKQRGLSTVTIKDAFGHL